MLGFILKLLGILFIALIAFIGGLGVMAYMLIELLTSVPVDEFISILNEYKELNITDEKEGTEFFQKKLDYLKYKYMDNKKIEIEVPANTEVEVSINKEDK